MWPYIYKYSNRLHICRQHLYAAPCRGPPCVSKWIVRCKSFDLRWDRLEIWKFITGGHHRPIWWRYDVCRAREIFVPDARAGRICTSKSILFSFYENQVEARCSYSKMVKISNFAPTLPLFHAFKMLFRMSTFISINSMIYNVASSWATSPDGRKSEPNCSYKVCFYKRKKVCHCRCLQW